MRPLTITYPAILSTGKPPVVRLTDGVVRTDEETDHSPHRFVIIDASRRRSNAALERGHPHVLRHEGLLIVDDSTVDKSYAEQITLVHRHWSGKHHCVVAEGS